MARKKRHKSAMAGPRKWLRLGVSLVFKGIGATVALSPTFRGLRTMASGNVEQGAADVLYDTTGISSGTPPDAGALAKTTVTVVAGLGIAWLGGQVARRL